MSERVYWGCTTGNCEHGFDGDETDFPRDILICPDCGGDLAEITVTTAGMRGIRGDFTRFDPEIGRSRCGRCNRALVTGQSACVCGARFETTLSA